MHTRIDGLRACVATLALGAMLGAQANVPPYVELAFPCDSGAVANPTASPAVVAAATVRVQGAAWLRLNFQHVALAESGADGARSILRITSHADGAVQELDATAVRQWRDSSAYFNGDTLEVELVAAPHTPASRFVLRTVWAGHLGVPQYSQCGASDDRVAANDPRSGRLMPVACTGWIFDDCMHCLMTAGHCAGTNPIGNLTAIEFNVPPSLPSGAIQHPPPQDQYPIDAASFQWVNGGVGNDWCYFGCFPNSNTALTPYQAQGAAYALASAPPSFDASHVMRITGFGTDSTPASANQTQQTSTGPYFSFAGSTLRYTVDTEGGNSGSAVQWENGGGVVIGVHTHAGCNTGTPNNGNHGTGVNNAGLQAALANPLGVCAPTGGASTYCTAKQNSLGCSPVISSSGTPSQSGVAGSFSVNALQLINQKSGLFYYGLLPLDTPFQGGFKCVAAPTVRTPLQSTAGSVAGADCSGSLSFDMAARIASGLDPNLVCGAIVYGQFWSRDPADPFTTNLTAGLRFVIGS